METAKIDTTKAHDGYSAKDWLSYKKALFHKIIGFITKENLANFMVKDLATSLHRIATILTSDLQFVKMPPKHVSALFTELAKPQALKQANSQELANSLWAVIKLFELGKVSDVNVIEVKQLLTELYKKREDASPQAIANSLWALAKLIELGKVSDVNDKEVRALLTVLHDKRGQDNPQTIANSLWALAKLIELGKVSDVNNAQIRELFTALHDKLWESSPQSIVNSLWALAKLIELGKISDVNSTEVRELLTVLYDKRRQAKPRDIANSLWAVGIIYTVNPAVKTFKTLDALIKEALHLESSLNEIQKNQIINALGLLDLENNYATKALIQTYRPNSNLTKQNITSYMQRKGLGNSPYTVETEAFVCGFFVDVLIAFKTGKKVIVEFDGPHHDTLAQQQFDAFRDGVLTTRGYTVYRDGYAPVALSNPIVPAKKSENNASTLSTPASLSRPIPISAAKQPVGFFNAHDCCTEEKKPVSSKESSYSTQGW